MRIESSNITMASSRTYQAEAEIKQTIIDRRYGGDGPKPQMTLVSHQSSTVKTLEVEGGAAVYTNNQVTEKSGQPGQRTVEESTSGPSGQDIAALRSAADQLAALDEQKDWLSDAMDAVNNDPTIQALRKALDLLDRLSGRKSLRDPASELSATLRQSGSAYRMSFSAAAARYQSAVLTFGEAEAPAVRGEGENVNGYWTRQVVESKFVKGEEHTAFTSAGKVVTADGRTIDFGISVEMSRSFEEAYASVSQEAVFTDPLVINLDTDAAALSDVSFYFDLDGDGKKEEMSALAEGSGFLALDRNGDGKINDGSELFGAKSGNGFGELAQYDQDRNGWIDENDEVFSKLSVWVKCGSGDSRLLSLKEAGVGAIFLGSESTQHSLADSAGNVNGIVRRSGVYLKENGQAGTVQHVDFKG